ncbi:glycosyltransferase family 2 protein [Aestuariivita boseongensis]|uniref:glycosyltransferase family 2 protein n=1 Tax=Aestuariivita boseongensis TaxID=1470562 RepID=UPI000681A556|nr:glycosyltransferase family 2 protein [Aestuariivita boseongensis]
MPSDRPETPEFSVVIISYNTRDMTLACLSSIYEQTSRSFEIVVVDNASSDGSADAIRQLFPRVKLLAESINHGFGGAHHLAVPQCKAPFLLLLNPDTVVLDEALDKLVAFAQSRPSAGIWGGRTLFADGRLNPSSCWHRQTVWSLFCRASGLSVVFQNSAVFNPESFGNWQRDEVREVDIVSGCFLLISRETWDDLGGFDPVFRMYGEEADLCLRAGAAGWRPTITPDATIVHYGGASEKVRSDKLVRLLKAKAELIKRHFSVRTQGIGLFLLKLWPLSRNVALSILNSLPGTSRFDAAYTAWRDVWRRRQEWENGF